MLHTMSKSEESVQIIKMKLLTSNTKTNNRNFHSSNPFLESEDKKKIDEK